MARSERIVAQVFPFDLFGNSGTSGGAMLLGDVLREVVDDAELEPRRTRQDAYAKRLRVEETTFATMAELAAWRATGRALVKAHLGRDFLVWLGGNHLSVLPVYEELGPRDVLIQFDAHLDCYDLHDCTPELSHGNFLLHAASLPKLVNVGHRDLFLHPADVRKSFAEAIPAADVHADLPGVAARLKKLTAKAERVWLDVDADAFDPSACPAVHQSLPCGLSGGQFLALARALPWAKVAGLSISEYDPGRDVRDASLTLLGWLLEWLLLAAVEG